MLHRRREIEQYFAYGLPPDREERMRAHLRGCGQCRDLYDEHARIVRALSGDPSRPTEAEVSAGARRALAALEVEPPPPPAAPPFDRRWALAGLGLASCCAAAIAWVLIAPASVAGQVEKARHATVEGRPLQSGAEILEGEVVVVEPTGMAVLALGGDRAVVRAFPGAELTPAEEGRHLALARGKIWCDVEKRRGAAAFSVETPEGTVEVVGTSFIVDRTGEQTDVRVLRGEVLVRDGEGERSVAVATRQRTRLRAGAPPSAPRPYAPRQDVASWKSVLEKFFDGVKKAFEAGIRQLDEILR